MLKDSFKRGLGYQFARLLITLAIAFIIALLSGKVHAATISTTDTYALNYYLCYSNNSCTFQTSHFTNKGTKYTIPIPSGTSDYYKYILADSRFYSSSGFKTGNVYTANFKWAWDPRDSYMSKPSNFDNDVLGYNGSTYTEGVIKSSSCSMTIPKTSPYQIYFSCIFELNTNTNYVVVRSTLKDQNHILSNGDVYMYQATVTQEESADIKAINQQTQTIINQTNEINNSINEVNSYIQDDSNPNVDVSELGGITGLLPAGPLDSLLTLPINLITILQNSTSGTCTPFTFNFVFDSTWSLPCFDDFWSEVPTALLLFLSDLPAVYIFIKWAKSIYKRVEKAVSFESSVEDEWGGV